MIAVFPAVEAHEFAVSLKLLPIIVHVRVACCVRISERLQGLGFSLQADLSNASRTRFNVDIDNVIVLVGHLDRFTLMRKVSSGNRSLRVASLL